MTSDGLGDADPPAGIHRLFALAPDCSRNRSPVLGDLCFLQHLFYVPIWFMEHAAHEPAATLPALTDEDLETLIDSLRRDPEALAEVVSRAGPDDARREGSMLLQTDVRLAPGQGGVGHYDADVRRLGPAF